MQFNRQPRQVAYEADADVVLDEFVAFREKRTELLGGQIHQQFGLGRIPLEVLQAECKYGDLFDAQVVTVLEDLFAGGSKVQRIKQDEEIVGLHGTRLGKLTFRIFSKPRL